MTKADLKILALIIVQSGISKKIAKRLFIKLKKSEQKMLLEQIKLEIQKNKISVISAQKVDIATGKKLKELFKKEKIEIVENKDLGAGLIIQDNDTIYDMSFKGNLINTLNAVTEAL